MLSIANLIPAPHVERTLAESGSEERGYYRFRGGWPRVVHIHILFGARRDVRPRQRRNRRSSGQTVDRRQRAGGEESDSRSGKRTRPGLRIAIAPESAAGQQAGNRRRSNPASLPARRGDRSREDGDAAFDRVTGF